MLVGAILVVAGPTVTLPLLAFVRPAREVRALLTWEGVLIDPFGAVLGVLVCRGPLGGPAGRCGAPRRCSPAWPSARASSPA